MWIARALGTGRSLLPDVADLVLGRCCSSCDLPGSVLCRTCWTALLASGPYQVERFAMQVWTAWPYEATGRRVILDYKERGTHALIGPLGVSLARCLSCITDQPLVIIPVPAHAQSLADRGTDIVHALATRACHELRHAGQQAQVARPLRRRGNSVRQVGLRRADRLALSGQEFEIAPSRATRGIAHLGTIVVVDDVVTTGATLRAATERLTAAGLVVTAQATIAATDHPGYAGAVPLPTDPQPAARYS